MNLDKHSLGELRGMSKPPLDIEDLMAAVIMICKLLSLTHLNQVMYFDFIEKKSIWDIHPRHKTSTYTAINTHEKKQNFYCCSSSWSLWLLIIFTMNVNLTTSSSFVHFIVYYSKVSVSWFDMAERCKKTNGKLRKVGIIFVGGY